MGKNSKQKEVLRQPVADESSDTVESFVEASFDEEEGEFEMGSEHSGMSDQEAGSSSQDEEMNTPNLEESSDEEEGEGEEEGEDDFDDSQDLADDESLDSELEKYQKINDQLKARRTQQEEEDDADLEQILTKLKEDEKKTTSVSHVEAVNELKKAKAVKNQKKVIDQCLQLRILAQKPMAMAERLPQKQVIDVPQLKECKRKAKATIKMLHKMEADLYALSKTSVSSKQIAALQKGKPDIETEASSEDIWSQLESRFEECTFPFFEDTAEKLAQMNSKTFSQVAQKKKVFGRSVTDQVADIMNDQEALKAAIERVSFKHDPNQLPIGADPAMELADKDPQIFNDNDFYKIQLGDFLAMSGQGAVEDGDNGTDGDYLHGADLSLTQKYLAKREKLKELNQQRKKEIDRRATKGRKIKYIVHDKLKNFMTPAEALTMEGKDSILRNMFGRQATNGEGAAIDLFAEVNA